MTLVIYNVTHYNAIVIVFFRDQATEDIFDSKNSREAGKVLPANLHRVARRKPDQLNYAAEPNDLRAPPGNRLETLTGDRKGQYSVRINEQYRICFLWAAQGPSDVEIVDYH